MFKFIKQYAETISGIEIYPLISFFIFFIFFILLFVWVFKADKGYIHEMESLPLEGAETSNSTNSVTV